MAGAPSRPGRPPDGRRRRRSGQRAPLGHAGRGWSLSTGSSPEPAILDESALTGEARPVVHDDGELVRSGVVNAGGSFRLRSIARADQSTRAGILRLVRYAQLVP